MCCVTCFAKGARNHLPLIRLQLACNACVLPCFVLLGSALRGREDAAVLSISIMPCFPRSRPLIGTITLNLKRLAEFTQQFEAFVRCLLREDFHRLWSRRGAECWGIRSVNLGIKGIFVCTRQIVLLGRKGLELPILDSVIQIFAYSCAFDAFLVLRVSCRFSCEIAVNFVRPPRRPSPSLARAAPQRERNSLLPSEAQ